MSWRADQRPDLAHLSPEALTQLTNAGLVKRALRELDAGYAPELELQDDATLLARFPDGIQTRWPAGKPITQAQCSCVAVSACRHRILAALRFRALVAEAAAGAAPLPPADAVQAAPVAVAESAASASSTAPVASVAPAPAEPASPGQVSDEQLAQLIAPALLGRARQAREAGLLVHIHRRSAGEPCDTARLPAATVRYWAGAAIEAARCDCVQQTACEHVVLGVWAFREADRQAAACQTAAPASAAVQLGTPDAAQRLDASPYRAVLAALLQHGVIHGSAGSAQALSVALEAAQRSGAQWLAATLRDVVQWVAAYSARSARYSADTGAELLTELLLRLHLGATPGLAKATLGLGQPGTVELDRLRLMCLGARTERDGAQRLTRLVLADLDTGTRMVLLHPWQVPEAQGTQTAQSSSSADAELHQRTSQRAAPGVRLEGLGHGQLLSQRAQRQADGQVLLAKGRSAYNQLLPQSGDWAALGAPLRHSRVASLRQQRHLQPHPLAQERWAARNFVVFSPQRWDAPVYDPHEQTVQCLLWDDQDQPLLLRRSHEAHTRSALATLAAALSGTHGPLRHVAGALRWHGTLPVLEPWSVVADGLLALDLAPPDPSGAALAGLPLARLQQLTPEHPLLTALLAVRNLSAVLLHHGVGHLPASWWAQAHSLRAQLSSLGWNALAQSLALAISHTDQHARQGQHLPALTQSWAELLVLRQLHEDALNLSWEAAPATAAG